jgi:predicted nucleic acid-binding protein
MVIVDTTVWIDYLGGVASAETAWLDREMGLQSLGMTDLILCEVLQGVRRDTSFHQIKHQLLRYSIFNSGGADLAIASAANYRYLRARGITIRKLVDCVIATFCIENGHTLLHNDRDFEPFEQRLGLRVIHP